MGRLVIALALALAMASITLLAAASLSLGVAGTAGAGTGTVTSPGGVTVDAFELNDDGKLDELAVAGSCTSHWNIQLYVALLDSSDNVLWSSLDTFTCPGSGVFLRTFSGLNVDPGQVAKVRVSRSDSPP